MTNNELVPPAGEVLPRTSYRSQTSTLRVTPLVQLTSGVIEDSKFADRSPPDIHRP